MEGIAISNRASPETQLVSLDERDRYVTVSCNTEVAGRQAPVCIIAGYYRVVAYVYARVYMRCICVYVCVCVSTHVYRWG